MRILLIDSLFQRRDPAQTDMYVLMSTRHELITDKIIGGMFKYEDYKSATNNKKQLLKVFNNWYKNQ